jgi:peptidoglycan/LPS O-acetylase OafA/YrhL
MLATQLASRRAEIVILPFLSALFFSCIVALAVTDAAVFPRWVRSEWLRNTGRYSYGMYLLHPVVMLILLIPGTPLTYRIGGFDFIYQVTMIFVLLFLSRMVAGFSWRRFEKRVLTIAPPYKFPPESKAA